jgi:hypothetical protein
MSIAGLLTTIGLVLGLGGATLVSRLPVAPRSARSCLAWSAVAVGVAVQALGATLGLSSRLSVNRGGGQPVHVQPAPGPPHLVAVPVAIVERPPADDQESFPAERPPGLGPRRAVLPDGTALPGARDARPDDRRGRAPRPAVQLLEMEAP